ncbi:uncharacterized protein LOC144168563 [Haemaphysalis longicornis]
MYGFQGQLSTQDILVQLRQLVIKKDKNSTSRAILATDLKGAFDRVTHDRILRNLRETGCGKQMFKYIRDFPCNRTAKLQGMEGIDHALYADDITVWTSRPGSDSWMEETLQRAAETVDDYARTCGLFFSPKKSELLIIKPRRKKGQQDNVRVTIDRTDITPTTQARMRGVIFQNNGKAEAALRKIKTTTEQITNMIRRVTNR